MKPIHILLVEDNEGDILLTTEALADSKILNTVGIARNGREALDYIFKRGDFVDAPTPNLVLLDINLPFKNGHEVLEIIKGHKEVRHLPVIMLTTSSSERDIRLSYQHRANCYISKPVEADQFSNAISAMDNFWINIVSLPANE
ncbi:MAG: response regulator [Sediminicola sp.]